MAEKYGNEMKVIQNLSYKLQTEKNGKRKTYETQMIVHTLRVFIIIFL